MPIRQSLSEFTHFAILNLPRGRTMKYLKFLVWIMFFMITVSCNQKDTTSENGPILPPSPDITNLATCGAFLDAFNQELRHINYCTNAAQCGQVLAKTSCGCTRNKVARMDADSQKFYTIISLAQAKECSLPLISICDCPTANGFACVENQCTWNFNN